jgi:peptidoglycan/xylan/chitin deacetylase (PgdA/CDA1 family)
MVQVFLTIDTECSMGGAWENPQNKPVDPERSVLGKIGAEYYGVPRIMDILEQYDLRGTFFIEVFAALNGFRNDLAGAYTRIVERGHDVQLHLHPIHYYYRMVREGRLRTEDLPASKDMIGAQPLTVQVELLREGISLFRDLVGRPPVAFRAGNFGASMTTLAALQEVGIRLDSSFNAAYLHTACKLDSRGAINRPWQHGALWEIPVTTFETGVWGLRALKPLNINAVSLWEMKSVLAQAEHVGLSAVTFIAHSFSLFKSADIQFRRMRPDSLVLRRFQGLCRFLKENQERFRVLTFSDIELASLHGQETSTPKMGAIIPALRKAVQAVNRMYWV